MRLFLVGIGALFAFGGVFGCSASTPPIGMTGINQPNAMLTGVLLRPGEPIVTKQILRVHVRYKKDGVRKSYNALFGPDPFKLITPDAIGAYKNLLPTWYIKSGWVWLAGDCPMVETDAVTACGDGTTMIGQIDGTIHRIFLIHVTGKESCLVKFIANPAIQRTFTAPREDSYVEVDTAATTISSPLVVSQAAQPIKDFVDYVKNRAGDAEVMTGS